jgi:integrase
MDRHRPRKKRDNAKRSRERFKPANVVSYRNTDGNDKRSVPKQHPSIHRFPRGNENHLRQNPQTIAQTLQNPRLLRITFHTFRHWKAAALYHQTKDPYYVQHFLGHKSLKSTEIYINIEHTLFETGANDEFTVTIAEKLEEIKELLEVGFEYICHKDTLIFLRKRK